MKKEIVFGFLIMGFFSLTIQVQAVENKSDLTGIVARGVNLQQARKICLEKGMRLPTIRELAAYAQLHWGVKGIMEPSPELKDESFRDPAVHFETEQMKEKGFYPIYKKINASNRYEVDNKVVDFYYSTEGANRYSDHWDNVKFWSSSPYLQVVYERQRPSDPVLYTHNHYMIDKYFEGKIYKSYNLVDDQNVVVRCSRSKD
jgi:hypothetical protein